MSKLARNAAFSIAALALCSAQAGGYIPEQDRYDGHMYVMAKVGFAHPSDFNAAAQDDPALSVNGVNVDFDGDVSWGAAFGYAYTSRAYMTPRAEFEFTHQKNDIDSLRIGNGVVNPNKPGDFRLNTYMLNGYVDFSVSRNFSYFGGLGVGVGSVRARGVDSANFTFTDSESVFAMQGTLGAAMMVAANTDVFVDARHTVLANADFIRSGNVGQTKHEGMFATTSFSLGLKHRF